MDDPALDPVATVRDILIGGPVLAVDFQRLCRERGVSPLKARAATRALGAVHRNAGQVGRPRWVWQLGRDLDQHIRQHDGRRGFYADSIWIGGKEVQCKLADDLDAARTRVAELLRERDAEREARTPPEAEARPTRKKLIPPAPTIPTLSDRLRALALECLHGQPPGLPARLLELCREAAGLEAAMRGPGASIVPPDTDGPVPLRLVSVESEAEELTPLREVARQSTRSPAT